jgi:NAD-dependent SIR2 family protein deacetylase
MMCLRPDCGHRWNIGYTKWELDAPCPKCDFSLLPDENDEIITSVKPGVVFFHEHAPMYGELYDTFAASLGDVILVMGTAGEVVNLHLIVRDRTSLNHSFTILNNKEYDPTGPIDYRLFDKLIMKPATEAVPEILEVIKGKMENVND